MWLLGVLGGAAVLLLVLNDAFEAMVLPRRVTRRYRPARLFYRSTWTVWRQAARLLAPGRSRETYLSLFGPLSLLALFATWMIGLMVGFALLHWSLDTPLRTPDERADFLSYLYLSGTTLTTLGYGDLVVTGRLG